METTQDVGIEIRRGAMTRDQGSILVKLYDGQFPNHNLDLYLDYYKMRVKEFSKVLDKWVNKKYYYKCSKEKIWKPKFIVDEVLRTKKTKKKITIVDYGMSSILSVKCYKFLGL